MYQKLKKFLYLCSNKIIKMRFFKKISAEWKVLKELSKSNVRVSSQGDIYIKSTDVFTEKNRQAHEKTIKDLQKAVKEYNIKTKRQ